MSENGCLCQREEGHGGGSRRPERANVSYAPYRLAGPLGYGYRQVETPTGEKKEQLLDAGENPPNGVLVRYWLRESPAADVILSFVDGDGREIRTFTSRRANATSTATAPGRPAAGADDEPRPTKTAGANSFVWNLRGPDATKVPDNTGRGGTAEALAGPRVPPGRYEVRLTVGDRTLTQPFQIMKDPRVGAGDADLREAYELAKRAHDLLGRIHDAVLRLRDVRAQALATAGRAESPAIADSAESLRRALTSIEEELLQVRSADPRMFPAKLNTRVATLVVLIEYSDAAPTTALRELFESLSARAETELGKLDRCLGADLAAFNALCRDGAVPAIAPRRPALG